MPRIKLNNFKDNTTLENFINHIEHVPTLDKVVFVVNNNDTLLLDVSVVDANSVFYTNWSDSVNNIPLLSTDDCSITNVLSEEEHKQLDLKGFM